VLEHVQVPPLTCCHLQEAREEQGSTPFLQRLQNDILNQKSELAKLRRKYSAENLTAEQARARTKRNLEAVRDFYAKQEGGDLPTGALEQDAALDAMIDDAKVNG